MNLGVRAVQDEEWLLFVDADVTCTPDLVGRSAFVAAGGWEALAETHADDVGLATLIRDNGGVVRFLDATALLTTSGIDTFGDAWRSLRKSIQPSMREMFGPWGRVLLVAAGLLHLAYGLIPILRWRSPWSWLAWFAQAASHREFVRGVGQPQVSAVLAPLSWVTIGVFLLDCALRPGAKWKDRRVG